MAQILQMVKEHDALMKELLNVSLSDEDFRERIAKELERYDQSND